MKSFIKNLKKAAVVLTVGVVCGTVAAVMLAPLGATVMLAGWAIAGGYGVMQAAGEVGL